MFGHSYFGASYYGPTYFGPAVEITVITRVKSTSGGGGQGPSITRKMKVTKEVFEKDDKLIQQLVREDEEILLIIVKAIEAGIIK